MPVLFDRSGNVGKPGSESNRFWCGEGSKCPWVNGERGPRCRLMHPPSEEWQEVMMMMMSIIMIMMVTQQIPTMTKTHHGGNLSVMNMVGICRWQNPTIDNDDDEVRLGVSWSTQTYESLKKVQLGWQVRIISDSLSVQRIDKLIFAVS